MTIDELEKELKSRTITPGDFLATLWRLSDGHTRRGRRFMAGKLILYRTRVYKEMTTPQQIKDLSYPPLPKVKLQRANDVNEQVFYASAGLPTTLAESRVKEGEFIVVSKWTNTREIFLQEIGMMNKPAGIEKIYHDIFTDSDESIYPYSSRIAHHLMKGATPLGLLYPSIINKNKSHNVALKKEIVDDSLVFINAGLFKVESISDKTKFSLMELDFATPAESEQLDWKGRKKRWIAKANQEMKMVANGWTWEAYSKDGVLIEPE